MNATENKTFNKSLKCAEIVEEDRAPSDLIRRLIPDIRIRIRIRIRGFPLASSVHVSNPRAFIDFPSSPILTQFGVIRSLPRILAVRLPPSYSRTPPQKVRCGARVQG
jgi:hypothetical protein